MLTSSAVFACSIMCITPSPRRRFKSLSGRLQRYVRLLAMNLAGGDVWKMFDRILYSLYLKSSTPSGASDAKIS